MDVVNLVSTFFIGLGASFIGAMVGGGGLLSIPFLIFIGLPPHVAIATNRMGALGLEIGALTRFLRSKEIVWKYVAVFSVLSLVAGQVGSRALIETNEDALKKIIVAFMLILLPAIFLKPEIGVAHKEPSLLRKVPGYILYFLALSWAAFFAGGSATILFYILMFFFGFTINQASATQKIAGFCISISSLWVFIARGLVDWQYGAAIFFGMLIGGYLGAHVALRKGNAWVKLLFAAVVVISALTLLLT